MRYALVFMDFWKKSGPAAAKSYAVFHIDVVSGQ